MNYEKTLKPMLFRSTLLAAVCTAVTFGCAKAPEDDSSASTSPGSGKYLYVASGACQAGGNTTFTATTASNLVYRVNMTTGARETLIADYNIGLTGDTPPSPLPTTTPKTCSSWLNATVSAASKKSKSSIMAIAWTFRRIPPARSPRL